MLPILVLGCRVQTVPGPSRHTAPVTNILIYLILMDLFKVEGILFVDFSDEEIEAQRG